jgi:H+-translocating diphosphatase
MVFAVADVVIPACAAVGIAFALWQWFLVSKVKVSAYAASGNGHHNGGAVFRADDDFDEDVGMGDEEEEEGDGVVAVARCAEIQSAISVGEYMFCRFKPCVRCDSDNPVLGMVLSVDFIFSPFLPQRYRRI